MTLYWDEKFRDAMTNSLILIDVVMSLNTRRSRRWLECVVFCHFFYDSWYHVISHAREWFFFLAEFELSRHEANLKMYFSKLKPHKTVAKSYIGVYSCCLCWELMHEILKMAHYLLFDLILCCCVCFFFLSNCFVSFKKIWLCASCTLVETLYHQCHDRNWIYKMISMMQSIHL